MTEKPEVVSPTPATRHQAQRIDRQPKAIVAFPPDAGKLPKAPGRADGGPYAFIAACSTTATTPLASLRKPAHSRQRATGQRTRAAGESMLPPVSPSTVDPFLEIVVGY